MKIVSKKFCKTMTPKEYLNTWRNICKGVIPATRRNLQNLLEVEYEFSCGEAEYYKTLTIDFLSNSHKAMCKIRKECYRKYPRLHANFMSIVLCDDCSFYDDAYSYAPEIFYISLKEASKAYKKRV